MPLFIRRRFLSLLLSSFLSLGAWSAEKTLLVYGDSLSAAYGLDIKEGWVYLLAQRLQKNFPRWQVINLSVSGETTAGGLSRFPDALKTHQPDLVLLQLGANDGLRGTSLNSMRTNLEQMLTLTRKKNIEVIMFEMMIPPNYGKVYTERFTQTFHDLGEQFDVPVVPFFLNGVAGVEKLNQPDGIHPVAEAQTKLLENVWPELSPILN